MPMMRAFSPRAGPVLATHRHRARSRACVDNSSGRRQRLRVAQAKWLRSPDGINTPADMQHHGPKRHSPDEMLHGTRRAIALVDDVAIAPEELVAGRLEQG